MDEHGRDWEKLYRAQAVETMPWYWPDLDPDFERALIELAIDSGRVLDMGAGPGTQAMALAKMGFEVTATDISRTAVDLAAAKARAAGLKIDWRQDDVLRTKLAGPYDVIFDRGLFHVLSPDDRNLYVANVRRLLDSGGYLFLKCFSHKERGEGGPHRLKPQDIRDAFSAGFSILSIIDTGFSHKDLPERRALFAVMRKGSPLAKE